MACWNNNTYWNLAAPWNYYVSLNLITEVPWKSVKRGLSPNIIVMVMNESQ